MEHIAYFHQRAHLGSHGANESQVILTALFPAETVTNGSQTVNRKNKFKSSPLVSLIDISRGS